jgi:two-component system, OmpR family, sensor histidine kinase KdpD
VIDDEDPVAGVLNVAYTQFVTQLVVGESRRSRWQEILRGSFVTELIRRAANVDIHVIAQRAR